MSQANAVTTLLDDRAARRARLTVPARVHMPSPRFPFVTLVTMILVGGVVGLLLFNTSMQQAAFAAAALERQAQALAERQQTLEMELEELRDPQRLAETARSQGMVPVSRPAFLRLEDGTFLGDPAPASRADALIIDTPPAPRPAAAFPEPIIKNPGDGTDLDRDTSRESDQSPSEQDRNKKHKRTNSPTD